MRPAFRWSSRVGRSSALCVTVCLTAGLAACVGTTDPQQSARKYGAINFVGKRTPSGQVSATATAVTFESVGLQVPNSSLQQNEQCVFTAVDTFPQLIRGDRRAGEVVSVRIGSVTTQLTYSAADIRYSTPVGAPILYNGGDIAQVSIPGSGSSFPAIAGAIRLAEPVELGPLVVPPLGENMTVTWNGTNDATAAMILQIKYPNPPASAFANEQVYCALRDDGSVVLPGGLLNQFQAATSKRSLTLVRWRTNFLATDSVNLHLTSSVDTTVVFP